MAPTSAPAATATPATAPAAPAARPAERPRVRHGRASSPVRGHRPHPPLARTPPPQPAEPEPGEMTPQEVRAYFQGLRQWYQHRYDSPFTLGVLGGYTFAMSPRGVNPYGWGVGGTLGYTIPRYDIYFGVRGAYLLGKSIELAEGSGRVGAGDYTSATLLAELGPEIILRHVRWRLLAGVGAALVSGPDRDSGAALLSVAVSMMIPMGAVYMGPELRAAVAVGGDRYTPAPLGADWVLGLRF